MAARADTPQARAALDTLCRTYRPAVLAYVRARGHAGAEAEDLTQGFFARFLEQNLHANVDPDRGRFRVYLRTALHNFLVNAWVHAGAAQRRPPQGMVEYDPDTLHAADAANLPEQAFERAFALTVIQRATARLRREARASGKAALFARLQAFLLEAPEGDDYARIAADLGMRANTIAVATHRLRERLRELVRAELADTVSGAEQVEAEYAALAASMPPGRTP